MMFALGIRYLTGYAVATDVSDRDRAEWPPHPARVFMALAASHFETGEEPAERAALKWIESLRPPAMTAGEPLRCSVVTHYVPVNDPSLPGKVKADAKATSVKAGLAVLPEYRPKQPRTFPRVRLPDDTVHLVWTDSDPDEACRAALGSLCRKVVRIGHSSSLVQMWVESCPPEPNWSPDEDGGSRLRVVGEGTLDYLKARCNADAIAAHADHQSRIASAKGKKKAALKKELAERFPNGEPTTQRPIIGLWQPYRHVDGAASPVQPASGSFDRELMILTFQDGPTVGLETTWQLLTGLRDTLLRVCDPTPEWVSGHRADRSPSQQPHLALLPLAFVGHRHADGHLLGVGLAFPKTVAPRERGASLRKALYDDVGQPKPIVLKLGKLGAWSLVRETRESPPLALESETWTRPSHTWATVTPIVLDRHPKSDYVKDRGRWVREAMQTIAESCRRQGLPELVAVHVGKTCWHRGAPRAVPGKTGFPLMPVKSGQPKRQQVHAKLCFDRPVEGPLLIGAGRYRGYGLCKPWRGGEQ